MTRRVRVLLFFSFWFYCQTAVSECKNRLDLNLRSLEFPPLEFTDKATGKVSGVAVDLVKHILESRLCYSLKIKLMPWTRALDEVRRGVADGIFTIYKNPERETYLDYSGEVLVPQVIGMFSTGRYQLAKASGSVSGDWLVKQLKNYTVGTVSTISYGKKFDAIRPKLTLSYNTELINNLRKMAAGRLDYVISNTYVAESTLRELPEADRKKIKKESFFVDSVPSYIAFSKKRKRVKVIQEFDKELVLLKKSGEIKAFYTRYGVSYASPGGKPVDPEK